MNLAGDDIAHHFTVARDWSRSCEGRSKGVVSPEGLTRLTMQTRGAGRRRAPNPDPDATTFQSLDVLPPPRVRAGGTLSVQSSRPAVTTEITFLGGDRCRVEGTPADVERIILDAARGAIMEFAWFDDADTGERLGINPECVVALRGSEP
jgi:hypothetical protein